MSYVAFPTYVGEIENQGTERKCCMAKNVRDKAPQYQIVKGPSKFDLAVALFHKSSNGEELPQHHVVSFTLEGGIKVLACLTSVSAEDAMGSCSRESWLIEGWFIHSGGKRFTGYLDTRNRKGYLQYD
jgi:hypothetical protein